MSVNAKKRKKEKKKMQTWTDYERQRQMLERHEEKKDLECITCKECGSQFFEEVLANRYPLNHQPLIVGQSVPPKSGLVPYVLLRCVRCSGMIEPRILHNPRDLGAKDYTKFIDTMKGKDDTRKGEDEVQNEKL